MTFHALGLVVVDEQHRFGVMQRAVLRPQGLEPGRAGDDGDADPAHAGADRVRRPRRLGHPRTPPGRTPIRDDRPCRSRGATTSYALVRREVDAGRQAYVVYPLVEESEKVDVRAATEMADHLAAEVFPECPRRRCSTAG